MFVCWFFFCFVKVHATPEERYLFSHKTFSTLLIPSTFHVVSMSMYGNVWNQLDWPFRFWKQINFPECTHACPNNNKLDKLERPIVASFFLFFFRFLNSGPVSLQSNTDCDVLTGVQVYMNPNHPKLLCFSLGYS